MKIQILGLAGLLVLAGRGQAQSVAAEVDAVYSQSEALYIDLHLHPELSLHEERTAAKLAAGLRGLGYAVTSGVGHTGVVGILKNGDRPGGDVADRIGCVAGGREDRPALREHRAHQRRQRRRTSA